MWSARWRCAEHGAVAPLQPFTTPSPELAAHLTQDCPLPIWLPWPLPPGWLVSGIGVAGDEADGVRATLLACSGPNPVGGPADLLLIGEEPMVGLGARFAGLPASDPGPDVGQGPADAQVEVDGHLAPLWVVPSADPDRAAYAGEAAGRWLWMVLHPQTAGFLTVEPLQLVDLHDLGAEVALVPFGALCPLLVG